MSFYSSMCNRYKNICAMYFEPLIYAGFVFLALVISKVHFLSLMLSFIPNLDTIQFHENGHDARYCDILMRKPKSLHWLFSVVSNTTTKVYSTLALQFYCTKVPF